MAALTTSEARREYPDTITQWPSPQNGCTVRTTWLSRGARNDPLLTYVAFPTTLKPGGEIALAVHHEAAEAFAAQAAIMRNNGWALRSWAGGTINSRTIAATCLTSLHAHAIAVDILPELPAVFTARIEAVRTKSGAQVFRRLPNDLMHTQIACTKADLRSGIDWRTVDAPPQSVEEIDMFCKRGDKSLVVNYWQRQLNRLSQGLTIDSIYGPKMEAAVAAITRQAGDDIGPIEADIIHTEVAKALAGADTIARKSAADALAAARTADSKTESLIQRLKGAL